MSVLGIGVRVWVGWCPPFRKGGGDPRMKAGVIIDGPTPARKVYPHDRGTIPYWGVTLDGAGGSYDIRQDLLTPIDDGDEAEPRVTEQPVEVTA